MAINFTVETTTVPVLNDDWSVYYDLLDHYPGAILIQDPIEPALVFAVQSDEEQAALVFVAEMMRSFGISCTKTTVSLAEEVDFDYDYADYTKRP